MEIVILIWVVFGIAAGVAAELARKRTFAHIADATPPLKSQGNQASWS